MASFRRDAAAYRDHSRLRTTRSLAMSTFAAAVPAFEAAALEGAVSFKHLQNIDEISSERLSFKRRWALLGM
jgi:hypothetical protein